MRLVVVTYMLLNLIALPVNADVIFFKDGMKTVCQEKAWEEDGQIKCEYAGWVLTYPKNEVLRIVKTNPSKNAASSEKNHGTPKTIRKDKTKKNSSSEADGIVFYNPRRPYKYWTGSNSKHKSYQEAIQSLATKYGRSPEWIQAHMGDTNDLEQIHENLANAAVKQETAVAQPSAPKSSGIVFYNPRRPFPYWTGKASKHKTYKEAIQALAAKYGRSPQWIQENMGESNDLNEIHQNLTNAD